jgi:tetratricopeptide (TPR) repeat protein
MLFVFGDPRNFGLEALMKVFLKKNEDQKKAEQIALENLNSLAQLIHKEQYQSGLELVPTIDQNKLKRLDGIDFLYLKSFCAVQILLVDWLDQKQEKATLNKGQQEELLTQAIKDLSKALEMAPRMSEAEYVLAWALAIKGEYEEALKRFKQAENRLNLKEVDFKHIRSHCLLNLARNLLTQADHQRANKLFDEVVAIGVHSNKIPGILVENRLLNVKENFSKRNFDEARKGLETIRQVKGLTSEQKKSIEVIEESMEILFLYTEKRNEKTLENIKVFLTKWAPKGLPEADDHTADEYLFPVIDNKELPIPAEIYRAFYFLQAVVMIKLKLGQSSPLTRTQAEELAVPLLKALQFEPRQRDILAALGALYFWLIPQKREKALEWLEAAKNMGVESDYVHRLLEHYQNTEAERRALLDRFMTLSSHYLADASINATLKKELAKELGQFHEFRPILLDLGDVGMMESKSPTLESLVNRAKYVQEISADLIRSDLNITKDKIISIYEEYQQLINSIQNASAHLEDLEKRIMQEIGSQIFQ